MDITLGAVVRDLRVKARLSQSELAAKTGLSRNIISQIERDVANPTLATLGAIFDELGCDLSFKLVKKDEKGY